MGRNVEGVTEILGRMREREGTERVGVCERESGSGEGVRDSESGEGVRGNGEGLSESGKGERMSERWEGERERVGRV